jgi:hypothetical protein
MGFLLEGIGVSVRAGLLGSPAFHGWPKGEIRRHCERSEAIQHVCDRAMAAIPDCFVGFAASQ